MGRLSATSKESRWLGFLIALLIWALPVSAYAGLAIDPDFNAPTANQPIISAIGQANGKIFIGGYFDQVGGVGRGALARLNANGALDQSLNLNILGTPGIPINVRAMIGSPNGLLNIAGSFKNVGGWETYGVARLSSNGLVDSGFYATRTAIQGMAEQADGKILLIAYGYMGGTEYRGVVRLNSDGSVDPNFLATGLSVAEATSGDGITGIAIQPDGKILLAGNFSQMNGVPRNRVARLNPDGSLDNSFNPGVGPNSWVQSIAVRSNGKILIGGSFNMINGQNKNGLARLNADGSLDASFSVSGFNFVSDIVVRSDGKVLISGHDGGIKGLNSDDSLDPELVFNSDIFINGLALHQDGGLLAFGSSRNSPSIGKIYRLVPSYSINKNVNPVGGGDFVCNPDPVPSGKAASCTATPNTGYIFNGFSGDCNGVNCNLNDVRSSKNVTANFTLKTYSVSGISSPPEGGGISCTPSSVNHGSSASCTSTANDGYTFNGFSGDCSGMACNILNVQSNKSVVANFTLKTYAVNGISSPPEGGAINCTPNPVNHGGSAICTVIANSAYSFGGFGGACTGPDCTLTNIQAVKNVTANFIRKTYSISTISSPVEGGSISCAPNPVNHGENITCTASAAAGFKFSEFSGDCAGLSCNISDVQAAKSVTGVFEQVRSVTGSTVSDDPTLAGVAEASFTGGGASCRFESSSFEAAPASKPSYLRMPQGMFHFKLIGCDNSPVNMQISWPQPVSNYLKFGPARPGAAKTFYKPQNLRINANKVSFTLQDGKLGDDDWEENGEIVDPNGPVEIIFNPTPVPTLDKWSLALLTILGSGLGLWRMRRNAI